MIPDRERLHICLRRWAGHLCAAPRLALACFVVAAVDLAARDVTNDDVLRSLLSEEVRYVRAETVIYSVSRKLESQFHSAAATTVISREVIARSGARSIPEVLRLVPGIHVARISANRWAITSRGFNGRFANKLLVLIDGRSVYTPLFSGVHWEQQDLVMDDIDRIEVIRGPGATIWGANAVNGVINIITRQARDTHGGYASVTSDFDDTDVVDFRLGGAAAEGVDYRVFGKLATHDAFGDTTETPTSDAWRFASGGFRVDWTVSAADRVTVQGAADRGSFTTAQDVPFDMATAAPFSALVNGDDDYRSVHVLTRWDRTLSADSRMALAAYYENLDRREFADFEEVRHTLNVEFQHDFRLDTAHEVGWGLDIRITRDRFDDSEIFTVDDKQRTDSLFSAFLQDKVAIVADRAFMILGAKLEHNDFTGVEVQPNLRLLWTPADDHALWVSAARAVRTPSRVEDGVGIVLERFGVQQGGVSSVVTRRFLGNQDFDSEELLAYEIGARTRINEACSIDIAGFYNDYSNLFNVDVTSETTMAGAARTTTFTGHSKNSMSAETYGAEVSVMWQLRRWWRIAANYAFIEVQEHNHSRTISDSETETSETSTPENQANLQSFMDLPRNLHCDAIAYYVDSLRDIDSYVRLDLRLAWQPRDDIEWILAFQNLLDDRHTEHGRTITGTINSEIKRTWYAGVKLRF